MINMEHCYTGEAGMVMLEWLNMIDMEHGPCSISIMLSHSSKFHAAFEFLVFCGIMQLSEAEYGILGLCTRSKFS